MKPLGTIYQALICITLAVWLLLIEGHFSNYFHQADRARALMYSSVHPDHLELVTGFTAHLGDVGNLDVSKREVKIGQRNNDLPSLHLAVSFSLALYF